MGSLFRSKNQVVYDLLHLAILKGEYAPGERIVIDDLAVKISVSQIPIREALRQLEADGFVVSEPYVGVRVTDLSADLIFEIFALLETMQVMCSRIVSQNLTTEQMRALEEIVDEMDKAIQEPDHWAELNKRFHLMICDYANTGLIGGVTRRILDHWDRLRLHYLKDVLGQRIEAAQQEHHLMIEAFRNHDGDEIEQLIRTHNQNALASYIEHLKFAGHLVGDTIA
jgi:DNA-binding GntR family transcriptional regulator